MLWVTRRTNTYCVKLSDEDMLHHSNKTESVVYENVRIVILLLTK